jgi:acetylornithine deacetylase/succinyl-diaminopimelate desuccinylase-like protein
MRGIRLASGVRGAHNIRVTDTPVDRRAREAFRALSDIRDRLASRDADVVATQIALAEIPSPTGEEERRARWVASRLQRAGVSEVAIDSAGNVVAERPGTERRPPVVVCAHLDTVLAGERSITVSRERDRLLAPGIGDNARGLAVMIALAEQFDGARLRTKHPIVFAATTGEEGAGNLRGARHLFSTFASGAHAAIALDGAGDDRIVTCAVGSRRFIVELVGPGGHSWSSYGVANPVHAVSRIAARLAQLKLPREPRTTLTVTRIGGGTAVNALPRDAWLEIDTRSLSDVELARLERELHTTVHSVLAAENATRIPGTPALGVEIRRIGDRPAGSLDARAPLVELAATATRLIGKQPELAAASTDANVPLSMGIPAIAIGGGGTGGGAHTPHEWFDNSLGSLGVARALTTIAAAAELEVR